MIPDLGHQEHIAALKGLHTVALRLRLNPREAPVDRTLPPVRIGSVTGLLNRVAEILRIATAAAEIGGLDSATVEWQDADLEIGEWARVYRIHMNSPLEVVVVVGPAVAASASGLAALVYLLKRLWGLDLELKEYREHRRALYHDAKRLANEAQAARPELVWGSRLADLIEELLSRGSSDWESGDGELVDWQELD